MPFADDVEVMLSERESVFKSSTSLQKKTHHEMTSISNLCVRRKPSAIEMLSAVV